MGNSGDGSNILDKRFREVGTGTATGNYSALRCNWPGWCDERMKAYWGTQD